MHCKGFIMIRRLQKSGNGWAIFLPKPLLELLKVNPETDKVELEFEGEVLKVKKYKEES